MSVHVDPAHPAFVNLPREQQARIYLSMGWSKKALAEEYDVSPQTIRYWTDPDFRDRRRIQSAERHRSVRSSRQQRGESSRPAE